MRFQIYKMPGWHGEPSDPVLEATDDPRRAAMLAGERMDIHLPGESNRHNKYAVDGETGERLEKIESFRCDECGCLVEWGDGPVGTMGGKILESSRSLPKHLVTWVCEDCAADEEDEDDEEDE